MIVIYWSNFYLYFLIQETNYATAGFTIYITPLALQSHTKLSVYLAAFALHASGANSILGTINFTATISYMKSPKVKLHKLVLFTWAVVLIIVLLKLSLLGLGNKNLFSN